MRLSRDSWNRVCLIAFLLLWAASCVRVPYPRYFPLQHVPTVVVLVALVWFDHRFGISRLSYTLVLLFLTLHLLGARYLYSYTPYDDWLESLAGIRLSERFELTRNHYDRLVHFSFGLLVVLPAFQFCRRFAGTSWYWSLAIALSLILSASACYEIFEWIAAIVMAPDWTEAYNGQQGDPWDAQKDMLLATIGAGITATLVVVSPGGQIESWTD